MTGVSGSKSPDRRRVLTAGAALLGAAASAQLWLPAAARATETPLPDRTNCDEIRGTQYRSVTEREFFLENCTT